MKDRMAIILVLLFPLIASCAAVPASLLPTSTPVLNAARVEVLSGKVQVNRPGAAASQSYTSQTTLEIGGFIQVMDNGKAKITLPDGSALLAGAKTDLELVSMQPVTAGVPTRLVTHFRMDGGELRIVLAGGSISIETPAGIAKVSGSIMTVISNPNGATRVACVEGACALENSSGSLAIPAGSSGIIPGSSSPPVLSGDGQWVDPNSADYAILIPARTLAAMQAVKTQAVQTQAAQRTPSPTLRPKP